MPTFREHLVDGTAWLPNEPFAQSKQSKDAFVQEWNRYSRRHPVEIAVRKFRCWLARKLFPLVRPEIDRRIPLLRAQIHASLEGKFGKLRRGKISVDDMEWAVRSAIRDVRLPEEMD